MTRPNYNSVQRVELQYRTAKCRSCKSVMLINSPCIKVCEAIIIPFGLDIAILQDACFCARSACIRAPPSYVRFNVPEHNFACWLNE